MKKILVTLTSVLFCAITFAQSVPQGINYQAVARDASGVELVNQSLTVRLSVISASATGTVSWQETHTVNTNDYGLFTAIIGGGISTGYGYSADFSAVDWASASHYIKVELDMGSGFEDMGTTELMSVPYALQAGNTETLPSGSSEQTLRHNGTDWVATSNIHNDGTNVGFGTTSPQHKIHAQGNDTSGVIYSYNSNYGGAAIKGEGVYNAYGYLGVQGKNPFDGTSLQNPGQEIGVLGISEGSSLSDNYGVFGHSNGWGGGFQHSTSGNKAELGGSTYAGYFTGDVNILGDIYQNGSLFTGPTGAIGPQGPAGPQGPIGPAGASGAIPSASCPAGQFLIGFDLTGNPICGTPPSNPLSGWTSGNSTVYLSNINDQVSIGTNNSNGYKLEVVDTDIGAISSTYGVGAVTDVDAHFDLNSNSNASWGSSINLFEFDENTQTFVDGWNIARQTTNGTGNSSLNFNYGTVHNNNSSSSKVTFTNDGRVGVGTTNPGDKLEVYGNGANVSLRIHEDAGSHEARLHLRRGGIDWELINGNGNDFAIEHEASEKFRIDGNTGNVGLGNSSPQYKLDVSGDINFTGDLYQNGSLVNFGGGNSQWNSLSIGGISYANNVGIGSGFFYSGVFNGPASYYPTNPLHVEDEGTENGGTIDLGSGIPVEEVVARFKNTKTTASPLTHSAVSVDAESGRDAIIYLSEDGDAKWGIRHDATDGSLEIRLQENGVNSKKFEITASGKIKGQMQSKELYLGGLDFECLLDPEDQTRGTTYIKHNDLDKWNMASNTINLPQDATITGIRVYYFDYSSDHSFMSSGCTDIIGQSYGSEIRLMRLDNQLNTSSELLASKSFSTSGVSTTTGSASTNSISFPTIDNDNYLYYVNMTGCFSGTQTSTSDKFVHFKGVRIYYDTDRID